MDGGGDVEKLGENKPFHPTFDSPPDFPSSRPIPTPTIYETILPLEDEIISNVMWGNPSDFVG